MDSLVAYFSLYGNTRTIAETIAGILRAHGAVRLVAIDQLGPADFQGAGLVIFGCPTYRMKLPERVRTVIEGLPRHIFHKTPAAVFDTSYPMSVWLAPFTASKMLARKVRRLGCRLVVPPETFRVAHSHEGLLFDGEIERAQTWADSIVQKAVQK